MISSELAPEEKQVSRLDPQFENYQKKITLQKTGSAFNSCDAREACGEDWAPGFQKLYFFLFEK